MKSSNSDPLFRQPRSVVWIACALGAIGLCTLYAWVTPTFDASPIARVVIFALLGACMFALVFVWPNGLKGRQEVLLIFALSILLRLCLIPTAPSDDVYRYVWEGERFATGISPYQATADSPVFEAFRDELWEKMNNKDKLTAYPPLAMMIFALFSKICAEPWFFKVGFILVDLGVIALIFKLQKKYHAPKRWVGLYAFNPVVLVSFAGEGHFDVLMVIALVATAVLLHEKRVIAAGIALACAVHIKVIAVLGIPFLLARGGWKAIVSGGFAGLLLALPFLNDLPTILEGIIAFGSDRSFNGLVHDKLHDWFDRREKANQIVYAILALILAGRFLLGRKAEWEINWLWLCGALLILSPTFHFWYLTWLLPVMAIRPQLSWLSFSVSQAAYFLVWKRANETGLWDLSSAESFYIWGPLICCGIYEARFWFKKKFPNDAERAREKGVSVVIPTLNAAGVLPDALASLHNSTISISEVVIADAHSEDDTRNIAQAHHARVIDSRRGRGFQIATGVAATRHETVVILHADSLLPRTAIEQIELAQTQNTKLVGGVLGQRFDRQTFFLTFIETLNEMRATLGGTGFGDQIHFINLSRFPVGAMPQQALMEDVELSLRLMHRGHFAYLGQEGIVRADKWKQGKLNARFWLVIRIVAAYRLARFWSEKKAVALSDQLFRIYYGAGKN
ncbi:MAG: glycosyltransferase [Verrucomicrobiota bacterium]